MDASRIDLVAQLLLLTGAALLIASLVPLRLIIAHLVPGATLRRWYLLAALDLSFIAGYVGYITVHWGRHDDASALLVPVVFLFGGWFVWLTFTLALRTVRDVRRIAMLEQENITDHLTGVYNRRYLDRRLDEEVARARRHAQPLAVLMIDIDHFKRVNDTHGHATGDLALGHIGHLTLNTARSSDVVARYGGEELLVITPSTSPSQALVLAERLRRLIETQVLVIEHAPNRRVEVQLTVSIGVAALDTATAGAAGLIKAADRAMYRAKAEGRNRVEIDRGSIVLAGTAGATIAAALTEV